MYTNIMNSQQYPPKPEEPLASDCCNSGCTPCILDIYDQELEKWRAQCQQIDQFGSIQYENKNYASEEIINPNHYESFEIINIHQETKNVYLFTFALPKSYNRLPLKVGQHLICRCTKDGVSYTRQFTPVSDYKIPGEFSVAIKIYDNGRMSQCVKEWTIESQVEWRGPFGEFTYKPNQYDCLVLLAAGTGIAPMIQIIRHILSNEDDDTVIHLLYSVKTYSDIMCKHLLDEWKDYWNFKINYFLTKEDLQFSETHSKFGEKVHIGRIQRADLETLGNFKKDNFKNVYFCICGTQSFDKDMINMLQDINVPEANYFKF